MKNLLAVVTLLFLMAPIAAEAGATRGRQELTRIPYKVRETDCTAGCQMDFTNAQIKGMDLLTIIPVSVGDVTIAQAAVMTCRARFRLDSQTVVDARTQICDFSGGIQTCNSLDTTWSKTLFPLVGVVQEWPWRVDVTSFDEMTCFFRSPAGGNKWDIHVLLATF